MLRSHIASLRSIASVFSNCGSTQALERLLWMTWFPFSGSFTYWLKMAKKILMKIFSNNSSWWLYCWKVSLSIGYHVCLRELSKWQFSAILTLSFKILLTSSFSYCIMLDCLTKLRNCIRSGTKNKLWISRDFLKMPFR